MRTSGPAWSRHTVTTGRRHSGEEGGRPNNVRSPQDHQLLSAAQAAGELVPFLVFLKSFESLLYEIMSWIVFYPRTLWRSGRHPLSMMDRSEEELKLPAEQQFKDIISPPIFLLLTVVAAHAFE